MSFAASPERRTIYKTMLNRRALLLLAFVLIFLPLTVRSQWRYLGDPIQAANTAYIHFLDEEGDPSLGFHMNSSGFYRTTNTGQSWTKIDKLEDPAYFRTGITFKNTLVGWRTASKPNIAAYKTTDGGLTWNPIARTGEEPNQVYYHKPLNRLFIGLKDGKILKSDDDGATFTQVFSGTYALDFAFSSPMNGVIGSSRTDGIPYTTDGGLTWQLGMARRMVSPVALGQSGILLGIAQRPDSLSFGWCAVFRSDDGGRTWDSISKLPYAHSINLWLEGSATVQYALTERGFWASLDTGVTWDFICGPPITIGSPFQIVGKRIFTAVGPYVNDDPLTMEHESMIISRWPLSIDAPYCQMTLDTFTFWLPGCWYSQMFEVSSDHPGVTCSLDTSKNTVYRIPFPVWVSYDPSKGKIIDTARIYVRYQTAWEIKDTTLLIYVRRDPLAMKIDSTVALHSSATCMLKDTTIFYHNRSCDTLWVDSLTVKGDPFFSLDDRPVPYPIAPRDSLALRMSASSLTTGKRNAEIWLHYHNGTYRRDTLATRLSYLIDQHQIALRPAPLDLHVPDKCIIDSGEITFTNTFCDTITIQKCDLSGDAIAQLGDITFPIRLAPDSVLHIPFGSLGVQQGKFADSVRLTIKFSDTTMIVSTAVNLIVDKTLAFNVELSAKTLDFGQVSLCGPKLLPLIVRNKICDGIELEDVIVTKSSDRFTVVPSVANLAVAGMSNDTIYVAFQPTALATVNGLVELHFRYNNARYTSVVALRGSGTDKPTAAFSIDTLSFGAVRSCEVATADVLVHNTGCDSLQIKSLSLSAAKPFTILTDLTDLWVEPSGSRTVSVSFDPASIGTASEDITVSLQTKNGTATTASAQLIASSISDRDVRLSCATISAKDLGACAIIDTTIELRNASLCDTLTISAIGASSLSATLISPQSFPVLVLPGTSLPIHYRFSNASITSGDIILHGSSIAGAYDTLITYDLTFDAGNASIQSSKESLKLEGYACEVHTDDVTITNDGCMPVTITSVQLSSASSLKISPVTLPIDLSAGQALLIGIESSPNTPVNWSGYLNISSPSGDRALPVSASILPTEIAELSLSAAGAAQASVKVGEPIELLLTTSKAFKYTSGDLITAFISYDGDMISIEDVISAQWNVSRVSNGPGRMKLQFQSSLDRQVASNETLGSLHLKTFLAPSHASFIRIDSMAVETSDGMGCRLQSAIQDSVERAEVSLFCGDELVARTLRGELPIKHMQIKPNPSAASHDKPSTLEFELLREMPIEVTISDATGRICSRITAGEMKPGHRSIELRTSELSAGNYFVRVLTPFGAASEQFQIIR